MIVKLLTERHLDFLSITGGCRGPSESTLVKMSNCWKSRALAHMFFEILTCEPSIDVMDHPDFIVCSFMENSIGLKRVKLTISNKME